MTHRFRPQKDCIGHFFSPPSVLPLRLDQVFSVTFGGAHNRTEFASMAATADVLVGRRPRDGYDIAGNRYAISRAIHARVIPNTNGIWIYPDRPAVNYIQARGLAVGKRREPAAAMPVVQADFTLTLVTYQILVGYLSCDWICRGCITLKELTWQNGYAKTDLYIST